MALQAVKQANGNISDGETASISADDLSNLEMDEDIDEALKELDSLVCFGGVSIHSFLV